MMKKRWISLLAENDIGVLARISGLFSGKAYNLNSLTVGVTEDASISRMTISLTGDDQTFEQIKKQLNRSVEVIKVIDFTHTGIHMKELMFIKIFGCTDQDMTEISRMVPIFGMDMIDCDRTSILLESVQVESRNQELADFFCKQFPNRIEIVRGGSVAIQALSITDR